MTGSKINTLVSHTVTLGTAGYGSPLTITASGTIAPTAYGADGVYANYGQGGNARVSNAGTVQGASAGYDQNGSGDGGVGIWLESAVARVENSGFIRGGQGSYAPGGAGSGGAGVWMQGADLIFGNTGVVDGGDGGIYGGVVGQGGAGVSLQGESINVHNSGRIVGGAYGINVAAGAGISLDGTVTLVNTGTIDGGRGGYGSSSSGGTGLAMSGSGTLSNSGTIAGGGGDYGPYAPSRGGTGASLSGDMKFTNSGSITGGFGGYGHYAAATGGTGLIVSGSGTVTNLGTITGGIGGGENQINGHGGEGGTGVSLGAGGSLINAGVISGGAGGRGYHGYRGIGGTGVYVNGGTLTNTGTITGGYGSPSFPGIGIGVQATGNAMLVNAGGITGSAGLYGGGTAVSLNNGTLTNTGTVSGGYGGLYQGGVGVYLNGGTVTNAGTIAGGLSAYPRYQDIAMRFGSQAGTLAVDPGAVFSGLVEANSAVNDVLALAGASAATLTGLGSQFTGFTTVALDTGAIWTIDTTIATVQATKFQGVTSHDALDLTGGGALGAANIGFGTLRLDGATGFTLSAGAPIAADVVIDAGAALSGAGAIGAAAKLSDQGSLVASFGKLAINGKLSGDGVLAAASGAVLDLQGGGSFSGSLQGAGTLRIDTTFALDHGASLAVGTTKLSATLKLGTAESLVNQADNRFIMMGGAAAATLQGPAGTSFTNDGSFATTGTGLDTVATAFVNAGTVSAGGGTLAFLGALTNNGTIDAVSGLVAMAHTIGGTGLLGIEAQGALSLQAAGSGQTVDFLATSGLLDLNLPAMFDNVIGGFGGSDAIDLINTAATSEKFANGLLYINNGSDTVATLHLSGSYTTADFHLASDGHDGTIITYV